ncbi:MAG TPA: AcrR family transcriptional regulator [Rhodobacteraceae bacterium]|nr:AcrR family transcriptional regulator [Paracoccaceae bacterium]
MKKTSSRGRPPTLEKALVVQTAMIYYWARGPQDVSINDICELVGSSKPSIYRAFGSDDGLKTQVLGAYQEAVIMPFLNIIKSGQSFDEIVDGAVAFMLQDREVSGLPLGCLFVLMRAQRQRLGTSTGAKVDQIREEVLNSLSAWIEDAKKQGEISNALPTAVLAHYVDAQHAGVMRMQQEGVPSNQIEAYIRYGFEALRSI